MYGLKKKNRSYPVDLKRRLVAEVVIKRNSKAEVSEKFSVPYTTVCDWVRRYGEEVIKEKAQKILPSPAMKKSQFSEEKNSSEEGDLKDLESENKKLQKKLLESHLREEALRSLLILAEENYGISILKNAGAKQSSN